MQFRHVFAPTETDEAPEHGLDVAQEVHAESAREGASIVPQLEDDSKVPSWWPGRLSAEPTGSQLVAWIRGERRYFAGAAGWLR